MGFGRSGGATAGAALDPPRFVEEAAAAGIDHRYDGEFTFFVGGGVAAFDCDDDARPDLYFAGGAEPAALYRNDSPTGGALRFSARPDPVTDLTDVTGAYPLDVDGDGHHRPRRAARRRERAPSRLGDCRFERANEALGLRRRRRLDARPSAPPGRATPTLPTLAIGNYLVLDDDGQPTFDVPRQRAHPARCATATATRRRSRSRPGWCTLSMLFSDWDRSGRRDLRVSNDRHYYRRRRGAALAHRARRSRRASGPREEGWQTLRIWGMGIASHDLTGDGYPEVYLTSQADNKLQTLADGADGRPTYEDIALESRRDRAPAVRGRHDAAVDRLARRVRRTSTTTASSTCSWPRATSRRQPDYAARDPSNLLLGQPDGTFVEGAEAAGHRRALRAPAGRRWSTSTSTACSTSSSSTGGRTSASGATSGSGTAAAPEPMGNWLAAAPRPAGPEPRRHRCLGRGAHRRADHAARAHGRRRARRRAARLDRTSASGSAERAEVSVQWPDGEVGAWVAGRGQSLRDDRARRVRAGLLHAAGPRRRMMRR